METPNFQQQMQQQQDNVKFTKNSRALEVSAADAPTAPAVPADTPFVEACRTPFPTEDQDQTVSEDEKEEMEEFTHYSSLPTKLTPESQVQNEESPTSTKKFSSSDRFGIPVPIRKSSSEVDQIFNHMKANEISNVEKRIQQARVINPIHPSYNDCNTDVSRAPVDGQQQLQNGAFAVATGFAFPDASSIDEIVERMSSNPNSPNPSDHSSRGVTPTPSAAGSALPNLSEAHSANSWAGRVAESKNHQSPAWFDKMDEAKQTRLRVTVLKYLEGTLSPTSRLSCSCPSVSRKTKPLRS